MTEKELKKLNRYQLLELLIAQTERADKLQTLLENAEKKLEEQEIKLSSLGSIAEASLQLNEVFESAQKAADTFVNAAKRRAEEIEEEARERASLLLAKALCEAHDSKTQNNI